MALMRQVGTGWWQMTTTRSVPVENSYVTSRAPLLKTRWERRLGRALEVQTDRLLPAPHGKSYHADVVLQDPVDGLPLVVFEVKGPGKTSQQAEENLRRILDTRQYARLLGGKPPRVVLLVGLGEKQEGERIKRAVNGRGIKVEVL